ncbi:hypothetical protein GCM10010156_65840 [Planobispora rosea]|uniref:Uncharacterized protein n=1 Tax=Planobispora rosea TaxID=35762 RepID=A0A8J3S4T8_PLARO|nr:hypothetical protein [Planobispora rosea]GGS98482.1 hypothetical protein GCM10010156_65840 [Planobispora rosea]GIH87877.1 hypothetical protein Pro02_62850 [Planobispora rosea]
MLWAYVAGRAEPVYLDESVGITAAQLLDAITRRIFEVVTDYTSFPGR